MSSSADRPRVTVFGPDPLLSVTIERTGAVDEVHVHPAGQGVWVARMAGELGAWPILCGFLGGETGTALLPLLEALPGERRLVRTTGFSGSYVIDRRTGQRQVVAASDQTGAGPARGRRSGHRHVRRCTRKRSARAVQPVSRRGAAGGCLRDARRGRRVPPAFP